MILIYLVVAFVSLGIIYSLRLKENHLQITAGKNSRPYRFAQVSDLHGKLCQKNLDKLIERVTDVDAIFLTGDIFDDKGDNKSAWEFLDRTRSIKKYYVTGNHEHRRADCKEIMEALASYNVVLLDDNSPQMIDSIAIYGVDDIDKGKDNFFKKLEAYHKNLDENSYNILLAHRPEYADYYQGFDLILSGHNHGGHFRLPFIGGLVGPGGEIWLGKKVYQKGLYELNQRQKIYVNVGSTDKIYGFVPRFYNPKEFLIIDVEEKN